MDEVTALWCCHYIFKLQVQNLFLTLERKQRLNASINIFEPVIQIHNYSTRFVVDNLAVVKFNKIFT